MVTRINRSEIRDPKFDRLIGKKIQVLGLLGHLSSSITRLPLNAYQTVSLTVTLLTYVMRILNTCGVGGDSHQAVSPCIRWDSNPRIRR